MTDYDTIREVQGRETRFYLSWSRWLVCERGAGDAGWQTRRRVLRVGAASQWEE
jgi:hypothetical protein